MKWFTILILAVVIALTILAALRSHPGMPKTKHRQSSA